MSILPYTSEHHQFRSDLREFLKTEITPYVDQWEKDHIVPKSAWQKMGKQGFLSTSISKTYGGRGGDFLYSVIVSEEMPKTNHSGLSAPLHSDIVVPYIDSYASDTLKQKYLPGCVSGDIITAVAMTEPGAGSDIASITTTAVEMDDMVIINGSKTFISNGINADLVILAARDPQVENAYQAISLYLVDSDAPGFSRGRQLEKMGFNSQDTAELFFSSCKIPKTNILGQKGNGFLMLMQKLQQERLVCSIGALASAESILDMTVSFLRTHSFNGKPMIKHQATQFAIVEMTTVLKVSRAFVEQLSLDHMHGKNVIVETSMAKYWTTDQVKRIAYRCMDLMGEHALLESSQIARAMRDVRVMSIFAGTNEIMKGIAAKFMGL
ncbi:MAG: acyl-CoA dehydrogenase family protein [Desulfobacterales bacterium]|nr:acyl-CoA dehydrogenase family protein [Desulfobacterales bacterium]